MIPKNCEGKCKRKIILNGFEPEKQNFNQKIDKIFDESRSLSGKMQKESYLVLKNASDWSNTSSNGSQTNFFTFL